MVSFLGAGYFSSPEEGRDNFGIVMPPPNVTGVRHLLGYARRDNTTSKSICE
jgi:valyl-tRNA synthetase